MANTKTADQTTQQPKTETPPSRKPVHELRLGKVKAVVWQNPTESGVFYNVSVGRLYKDNDSWRVADSFGRDDLPAAAEIVRQTWLWIFRKQQETD